MIRIDIRRITSKRKVSARNKVAKPPAEPRELPEIGTPRASPSRPLAPVLRVHVEGSDATANLGWAIYQGPGRFLLVRSQLDYRTPEEAYRAGYEAAEGIARRLKAVVLKHSAEFD